VSEQVVESQLETPSRKQAQKEAVLEMEMKEMGLV
jgi:hypothetical protein